MAKVKKKVNRLVDFSISEVSLVDRPANDQAKIERISVAKRADAPAECEKCKALGEGKKCDMHMKEKAEGTPLAPDPVVSETPEQRKGLLTRVAQALGFHKVATDGDKIVLTSETPRLNDGKFTFDISNDTKAFLDRMGAEREKAEKEKRDFSEKERQAAADKGHALSDGSFPIENVSDLENAVKAFGRAKDPAKAKAHIISRAKDLKATDKLPADWPGSTKDKDKAKAAAAEIVKFFGGDLQKGMYAVAALASLVSDLANAARAAMYENEGEGDDSKVPEELAALRDQLGAVLVTMAAEEVAELKESNDGGVMAMADELTPEMKKMLEDYQNGTGLFAKAGAVHSKATMEKMQDVHDHLAAMGAGPHTMADDAEKLNDKGEIEKRGRYSKADKEHLDAAHEVCKGFGVGCMTPKVESAAALDAFKREVTGTLESFMTRIEKTLSEKLGAPTAVKPNITGLAAVNRDGTTEDPTKPAEKKDEGGTGEPVRKVVGDAKELVGMISKLNSGPGRNITELFS